MKTKFKEKECKRCSEIKQSYNFMLDNRYCFNCSNYTDSILNIKVLDSDLETLKEFIYYIKDKYFWADQNDLFKLVNIGCNYIPERIIIDLEFDEIYYYLCKFYDEYIKINF